METDHDHAPWLVNLPRGRRQLVLLLDTVQFGVIENLAVIGGEPSFYPEPNVVLERRISDEVVDFYFVVHERSDCHPRILALFKLFDRRPDFTILALKVENGLPVHITLRES